MLEYDSISLNTSPFDGEHKNNTISSTLFKILYVKFPVQQNHIICSPEMTDAFPDIKQTLLGSQVPRKVT
jgi:hypothetical protein